MRTFHCLFRRRIGDIRFSKAEQVVPETFCKSFSFGEGCIYFCEQNGCLKQNVE